ncbi:MAG: polysaccharide pyruvyl transferase CsaB [Oscillospiraceae bacterium]|nr:polysaccharide pyruvyl transferase CsaB [Oscillospiraceae bacterium]
MKVLHLISGGDVGGAKTHILSLLNGLSRLLPVHMAVFREGPFADEARALGIPLTVLAGGLRSCLDEVAAIVRDEGYTIVHSHGSRANLISGLLTRRVGVPTVTTVHSDYRHDYLGRPLARLVYGNLNKWALRRLDYYIGVSRVMTDILRDRGFPPDRVFTLYNGLDFSAAPPPVDKCSFWRPYGFDVAPGDVVCGIAARLTPVKGIDMLLRAFAEAADACPRLKLAIAGDGSLRRKLEARADALPVRSRICFAGWVSDMDAFYQAIDINLLTSLTENFPYALVEGARASLPTAATAVGGVPALVDDLVSGFLVAPGDYQALAEAIVTLYGDSALRAEMGRRLHDKAESLFSLPRMLDTQMGIYRDITRKADRKAAREADRKATRKAARKTDRKADRQKGRREGTLVCGAYGRGNAGDDAILEGILQELRAVSPDTPITVMSRNPRQTRRACGVGAVHTFNLFGLMRTARRAKLFLSGGGNLIQNVTSRRSLLYYLGTIALARRMGAEVLMYACGVGPLSGRFSRRLTASVLNRCVRTITLREDSSLHDLERLGVTRPRVVLSADPALILDPSPRDRVDSLLKTQDVPLDGNYAAFVLRRWPGFRERSEAFAIAADYAEVTYGLIPLFLPIEKQGDVEAARLTAEQVLGPCRILRYPDRPEDAIGLLRRCKLVVAMRLHALIFASSCSLPLVGVAYDDKVSAFLQYMGQETFMPFADVDADALCALIDRAMTKPAGAEERQAAVRRLRGIEARNVEILRDILG